MLRDVFWTFLLCNGDKMVKMVYVKKSMYFKMVMINACNSTSYTGI